MWWMKKFRKRKMQSLLIFLVVALCSTLISGSFVLLTSMTSVYEELAEQTNAPDVKVYTKPGYERDMMQILEKCDAAKKVERNVRYTIPTLTIREKEEDCFLDLCEYQGAFHDKLRMLEGTNKELKEGQCLLPKSIAVNYDAQVGDEALVSIEGKEYVYEIVGIYAEIYSATCQYTCDMIISKLPENTRMQEVYGVWLEKGQKENDLIEQYAKENDGIVDGYFRSKQDAVINAELTELILGGILLGISTVVLLAILLILDYIVKNSFAQEKGTIAVYKTLGYSGGQIKRIYITFYLFIIAMGTIVGGILSPILTFSFTDKIYESIGYSGGKPGIWQITVCCAGIILIAFLMLLSETNRIIKWKPVEILTGADEKKSVQRKKNVKTATSYTPFHMALRMFARDRKNTFLLILTCVISLYIVNVSVVCLQNISLIRSENNYYWLGIDKHDITIESKVGKERFYEICEMIKEEPEIDAVVRKNYDCLVAIPYHRSTSAMLFESFSGIEAQCLQGRNPVRADEIAVSNAYMKELGLELGDYLTLQLSSEKKVDFVVVGTFQGFYNMGRAIRMVGATYEKNDMDFYEYNQASILLREGTNIGEYGKILEEKYGDEIKVIERTNLFESIMNTICDPQEGALRPFGVIAILIGTLNVFYIIYASNVEKRKTYTIYKSLGFTSGHLLMTNCIYVGIIAVMAIVVAIPALVLIFPRIMVLAMSSFGFAEYKLTIRPMTLVLVNSAMLLVLLGSSCVAAVDIFRNYIAKIMSE